MNDKQIAALLMGQLLPAIRAHAGLADVRLARNFQARQHGAPTTPYVFFVKLSDRRYGHVQRREEWDVQAGQFRHVERQRYESLYQFSAWVPQEPADAHALTESDILNIVSGIIQSDTTIAAFQAADVGMLRITDVRNPYIVNDRDQFEGVPTFDVVLTHTREIVAALPAVVTYDAQISRI